MHYNKTSCRSDTADTYWKMREVHMLNDLFPRNLEKDSHDYQGGEHDSSFQSCRNTRFGSRGWSPPCNLKERF